MVAHLCNALVSQGHDVTLFASADARTRARLVPMRQQALRLDPAPLQVRHLMLGKQRLDLRFQRLGERVVAFIDRQEGPSPAKLSLKL